MKSVRIKSFSCIIFKITLLLQKLKYLHIEGECFHLQNLNTSVEKLNLIFFLLFSKIIIFDFYHLSQDTDMISPVTILFILPKFDMISCYDYIGLFLRLLIHRQFIMLMI